MEPTAREELTRVGERARRGDLEREVLLERPPPTFWARSARCGTTPTQPMPPPPEVSLHGKTTRGGSASVTRTEPRSTSYGGGRRRQLRRRRLDAEAAYSLGGGTSAASCRVKPRAWARRWERRPSSGAL